MPLLSDNVHAQAMREPRVVPPPYSLHTIRHFRRVEAALRQGASNAGFARRTQPGMGVRELFDPSSPARWRAIPEKTTGSIVRADA